MFKFVLLFWMKLRISNDGKSFVISCQSFVQRREQSKMYKHINKTYAAHNKWETKNLSKVLSGYSVHLLQNQVVERAFIMLMENYVVIFTHFVICTIFHLLLVLIKNSLNSKLTIKDICKENILTLYLCTTRWIGVFNRYIYTKIH